MHHTLMQIKNLQFVRISMVFCLLISSINEITSYIISQEGALGHLRAANRGSYRWWEELNRQLSRPKAMSYLLSHCVTKASAHVCFSNK